MPVPASLEIPDIPGSCEIENRTDHMEVFGFDHQVYMPVDDRTGLPTGVRVHKQIELIKKYDKGTPELYKALCNGKVLPTATIHWYKINPEGVEEEYFTHTLTNARITEISLHMPDVYDLAKEKYEHMEKVCIRYEKIEWLFVDGNITHEDSWLEGR
jgi:type VI secretion system secreted protein Hcp